MHPVGNEGFGTCATITYVITATAKVGYLEESVATLSSVYPNPLHGEGKIDYNIPSGKIGRIVSRDISGKIIGSFENLTSTGRVLIRDSEYAPGLYFTTIEVNGVVASTKRFVVAK